MVHLAHVHLAPSTPLTVNHTLMLSIYVLILAVCACVFWEIHHVR